MAHLSTIIKNILTPSSALTCVLSLLMVAFSLNGAGAENYLEFNRLLISSGEVWRLAGGNFVHYGAAHLAMNLAAFLIVGFSLLRDLSLKNYCGLFIFCCLGVGFGVYYYSLELFFYRGLSGVLHGLIIAGFYFNRSRNPYLAWVFIGLVMAKIAHEHQAGFQENQLQALLPVQVAVDAHLYGAIAGIMYCILHIAYKKIRTKASTI